jgi:phospholipase/carboxylesterase
MSHDLGFIHHFVPASNGSRRVLLLLHGTGGNELDLVSLGHAIDPEAALLSPRGKVLENGAPRFFRRFAEGVFDEEDVVRRARELADFVAAAEESYDFDAANVVAVGYSNGANIAAATMLVRPEAFPAAVLFRAMVSLTHPPVADLSGRRVLISNGESDPIIAPENARRLATFLEDAGAEVNLKFWPAGHQLLAQDVDTARAWLKQLRAS